MKKILIILLFITKYCFGQYPYTLNGCPLTYNDKIAVSHGFLPSDLAGLKLWLKADDGVNYIDVLSGVNSITPSDISGLNLWLKADAGITKDGSNFVSSWADQSGNGNNAIQSTAINQPLFVANAVNGNPVIRFDGSNDFLKFTNISNARTIFIVMKHNTCSGNVGILGGTGSYDFYSSSAMLFNSTYASSYVKNGSVNYNGNNFATLALQKPLDYQVISIVTTGNVSADNIGTDRNIEYLSGDYAELLVYNTALSNSDRQGIEKYLLEKYSLSSNYISEWNDQSGNNNDLTALNQANKPLFIIDGLNSKPTIYFNGANYLNLPSGIMDGWSDVTLFIVVKPTVYNSGILGGTSPFEGVELPMNRGVNELRINGSIKYKTGLLTPLSFTISDFVYNSTKTQGYINGIPLSSASGGSKLTASDYKLGMYANVKGDFIISEFIIYNTSLSDTDRQQVEQYLNAKYAIY